MKKLSSRTKSLPKKVNIRPNSKPKQKENNLKEIPINSENFEEQLNSNCNEMKEIAEKIHKANILKAQENKIKDEEIDSLNEEIRQVMINNADLQREIQEELNLRHKYEKEQREIADYCNSLCAKFREMDKTISDYEKKVNKMKKDNEDLADFYDKKIDEIEKENKKLTKRIDNRIELFNHQQNEIYEKTSKITTLDYEIQREKDLFNERNRLNKDKFDELKNKYDTLLKKVYELQLGCGLKKADGVSKVGKTLSPEEKKRLQIKEIEKKIENCEKNNDELVEQINDLNNQYKQMAESTDKQHGSTVNSNTMRSTAMGTGTNFKGQNQTMVGKTFSSSMYGTTK